MNTTQGDIAWRRLATGSFVTLLVVGLAWNAAALVIDWSELEQRPDSWGMLFGSIVTTVFYGGVPLLMALVVAVVAGLGTPRLARPGAWFAATIAAACSAGLLLAAALLIVGPPAEVAFGVVSVLLAVVLIAPLLLCIRQYKTERA